MSHSYSFWINGIKRQALFVSFESHLVLSSLIFWWAMCYIWIIDVGLYTQGGYEGFFHLFLLVSILALPCFSPLVTSFNMSLFLVISLEVEEGLCFLVCLAYLTSMDLGYPFTLLWLWRKVLTTWHVIFLESLHVFGLKWSVSGPCPCLNMRYLAWCVRWIQVSDNIAFQYMYLFGAQVISRLPPH